MASHLGGGWRQAAAAARLIAAAARQAAHLGPRRGVVPGVEAGGGAQSAQQALGQERGQTGSLEATGTTPQGLGLGRGQTRLEATALQVGRPCQQERQALRAGRH